MKPETLKKKKGRKEERKKEREVGRKEGGREERRDGGKDVQMEGEENKQYVINRHQHLPSALASLPLPRSNQGSICDSSL
jgi:hypothetical protein